MKLFVKEWYTEVYSRPFELVVGVPVFAAAAAGGAVAHVASTSFTILLLVSLFYVKSWPLLWRQLTSAERLIFICFSLYFLSAVFSYYNANDEHEYFKHLDRYFRFILAIPVYLLLLKVDVKLFRYLLAGAIVSGPLYLCIAYLSLADSVTTNAKGGYHHITFGDMAMLNAVFMITLVVVMKMNIAMKVIVGSSIVCLLYASILSQARGAWLALPLCLLFLLPLAIHHNKIKVRTILVSLVILGAFLAISPAKEIFTSRVQKAVHEVELFQSDEQALTSVGARLAMWHVAINTWKKHPVLGTGLGDFGAEVEVNQEQGQYIWLIQHSSTHNIFFQALATTGIVGLIMLCLALFVIPLRYFHRLNHEELNVASVCGIVMLIAYAVFGLTESWILRSPPVSVYLLYFVTLVSVARQSMIISK